MPGGIRQNRRQPADSQSPRSKRSKMPETERIEADTLCERCRGIHTEAGHIHVKADLGVQLAIVDDNSDQLLGSACMFCRLLGSIKDQSLDGHECRLYAYSANAIYARIRTPTLKKHDIASSVLLGIVASTARSTTLEASDFIGVVDPQREGQSTSIGPRRIRTDRIDYAMIKSWISFCESKHKRLCNPSITEIVEKLRVIDVDTLDVIDAPENCEYVALSYVWGAHAAPPGRFPKVVEDSFVVTKKLGYKYVWVDNYCIDQNNVTDKHDQIKAMNLVYGNAKLTLIAAAGEGSDHGLPGVGTRERVGQNSLSIDDHLYIQTFPHASWALDTSRWATRGWTLQEAMLSNRRLVFTDYQVAFQCNGMHCSEAVHWPYELMHAKSSRRLPENVPRPPFGRLTLDQKYYDVDRPYFHLLSILEEYSNRTLSYSSDSLNAFLGILSSFASRKNPIYHVWGVPLVFQHNRWDLKLNWRHRQPCNRQTQFPSWSWAGWSGPVTRGKQLFMGAGNLFLISLEKDSRGEEAEIIDLQDFGKEHGKYHMYASGSLFLRLRIWAVDLEFTHVSWSGVSEAARQAYYDERNLGERSQKDAFKEGLYAKLPRRGYTELAYFYIDDKDFDADSLQEKSLPAMMFDDNPYNADATFIILIHRGEDRYERLGYVLFRPASPEPTADTAFRSDSGRLSKVRPDIAPSVGEHEQLLWKEHKIAMDIRLS